MPRLRVLILLCFAGIYGTPFAKAQSAYAPTATNCISQFYDPANYNWLAYRNNCTDRLNVTWVSRDGTQGGALEIRPGGSANTGRSRKEVSDMGGTEAYACPEHYIPVDANDKNITRPVSGYRCKYQGS